MKIYRYVVVNSRGLHTRACARIVNIANHCRSSLFIVVNGKRANARSIVAVMLLTATMGATVRVEAEGPDEEIVIREIATLFHDGLGER